MGDEDDDDFGGTLRRGPGQRPPPGMALRRAAQNAAPRPKPAPPSAPGAGGLLAAATWHTLPGKGHPPSHAHMPAPPSARCRRLLLRRRARHRGLTRSRSSTRSMPRLSGRSLARCRLTSPISLCPCGPCSTSQSLQRKALQTAGEFLGGRGAPGLLTANQVRAFHAAEPPTTLHDAQQDLARHMRATAPEPSARPPPSPTFAAAAGKTKRSVTTPSTDSPNPAPLAGSLPPFSATLRRSAP